MVRLERLGKLKKKHLFGNRTRDLPACSIVPQLSQNRYVLTGIRNQHLTNSGTFCRVRLLCGIPIIVTMIRVTIDHYVGCHYEICVYIHIVPDQIILSKASNKSKSRYSCAHIRDKQDKYISIDQLCMINFFALLPSICVKFKNHHCAPSNKFHFYNT
jgi:hypothetical protein